MKRALIWAAVSTRPQANEEEKFSIPKQIEDATAMCSREGWQIVDVLKVPGHSRDYRTLEQLASDARKKGIDAFDKLIMHFEQKDFDVFICRDANRFARKASLLHYIAEMIVEECGALIYSQNDNMFVDGEKLPMWATLQGYKVRAEVRWLVKATREGLIRRAERGLTTTRAPFSHNLLYDDRHKVIGIEIDESKRRLFDDLAYLIVEERLPFNGIEKVLYERFGHVADDGQPYGDNIMYQFLFHPLTWGATTYGFDRHGESRKFGVWVFDEDVSPPEGVELFRGTIPPIYTGQQASRLKGELRRRSEMRGGRRPNNKYALSGLFVCDECGYSLNIRTNPRAEDGVRVAYSMRCGAQSHKFQFRPTCTQVDYVPVSYLQGYLDTLLQRLVTSRDLTDILPDGADYTHQIDEVTTERTQVYGQMDTLIDLQGKAHAAARARYQKKIDALAERVTILERRILELQAAGRRYDVESGAAYAALDDLAPILDALWQQDGAKVNQLLHRLMGSRRFAVRDGEIKAVVNYSREHRRRKPYKQRRSSF